MTEKEIAELRRRFRADKSNISHVYGCYVNENREIISRFDQSLGMMGQEEGEKLLAILRKTLSGTLGKNLLDIEFETRQVTEGEEHHLLMALRDSELRDDQAAERLFQKVIDSADLGGNYLILLTYDAYDVPYRARDGLRQDDASSELFRYILCSICPVKLTKEALSYFVHENQFRGLAADWVVAAPEAGFLFPAFDERSTNLYNALFYTKDTACAHEGLLDALFRCPAPMPAAEQMESFHTLLQETLGDDCSYQVVQSVHETLRGLIETHKEEREEQPLTLSREAMGGVLRACGVEQARVETFEARYDGTYGEGVSVSPRNLVDPRQLELRTPDVTIRVSPARGDLIQTRVIDGQRYILIRAEEGVEVNGVPVCISDGTGEKEEDE